MRAHLYEFRTDTKRLKCLCGWERTLKTVSVEDAYARFEEHREEVARAREA